jgi:hypothetical protein
MYINFLRRQAKLVNMAKNNKQQQHKPRHIVNIVPGGGRFMWLSAAYNAEVEKTTGHYMRDLCTGGFVGSSGGAFIAAASAINNPKDSTKPLFSMPDFEKMAFEQLPSYLENKPHFYVNHIIRMIARMEQEGDLSIPRTNISNPLTLVGGMTTKMLVGRLVGHMKTRNIISERQEERIRNLLSQNLPYDQIPIHLDRTYMEKHLEQTLSSTNKDGTTTPYTMDDIGSSLCITTQQIFPEMKAYDFFKMTPEILKENPEMNTEYPGRHVPIYKMVLASAAMPTAFASYTIPEVGATFTDSADIDTGIDNVLRIRKSAIHEDFDVGILYSGNTVDWAPVPPLIFDNRTFIEQLLIEDRYVLQRQPIQSRNRMRNLARAYLGEENVKIFEIKTKDNAGNKIVPFDLDVTRTSEEELSLMREFFKADYIKRPEVREQINLTAEFLMNNLSKLEAYKIGKNTFEPKKEKHTIQEKPEAAIKAGSNEDRNAKEKDEKTILKLGDFEIVKKTPPKNTP